MREKKEKWFELCEQAAVEQDPEKLMALVRQINVLLDEKEQRIRDRDLVRPPSAC
jgi:hypothetical protein